MSENYIGFPPHKIELLRLPGRFLFQTETGEFAAKIKVTLDNGKTLHRDVVSGEGLCSDQSHIQIFGLGDATATDIAVYYIGGETEARSGEFVNTLIGF